MVETILIQMRDGSLASFFFGREGERVCIEPVWAEHKLKLCRMGTKPAWAPLGPSLPSSQPLNCANSLSPEAVCHALVDQNSDLS